MFIRENKHLLKHGYSLSAICQRANEVFQNEFMMSRVRWAEYGDLDELREKFLMAVSQLVKGKSLFTERDLQKALLDEKGWPREKLRTELHNLASRNFFFYDPATGEYQVQGRSMQHGLDRYVAMIREESAE